LGLGCKSRDSHEGLFLGNPEVTGHLYLWLFPWFSHSLSSSLSLAKEGLGSDRRRRTCRSRTPPRSSPRAVQGSGSRVWICIYVTAVDSPWSSYTGLCPESRMQISNERYSGVGVMGLDLHVTSASSLQSSYKGLCPESRMQITYPTTFSNESCSGVGVKDLDLHIYDHRSSCTGLCFESRKHITYPTTFSDESCSGLRSRV